MRMTKCRFHAKPLSLDAGWPMSLLFNVLYAAHAKGTHHKLALDALEHLDGPDAEAWRRVFLKYAPVYMQGSKAPDDEFKDFKNHVLHVRDNFWGGAPEKARSWYSHLVEALERQDWQTAVYCAGVLSHYVTDPVQPLHTGQSEAENNVHRAIEWSISKSYDDLRRLAPGEPPAASAMLGSQSNWLETAICNAATEANKYYEKLMAHYDIHTGVVDPPSGLDAIAKPMVGRLIRLAAALHGAVLQRAITESKAVAPDVSLTLETVLSTLQVPVQMVLKKMADGQERRQVQAMYDELRATGTVDKTLSDDDRAVRDLYAAEVQSKRVAPNVAKRFPYKPAAKVETSVARRDRLAQAPAEASPAQARPEAAAEKSSAVVPFVRPRKVEPQPAAKAEPAPALEAGEPVEYHEEPTASAGPRIYLKPEQDVVDAPSIGPKTAERLNAVGIDTVDDLLKAHPIALAARLDDRHFTEQVITDWQDQTRLVCFVPGLRGTGAQLLVGAGYRTVEALAEADADKLCADVLAFAAGKDGQRFLRNGNPPDMEKIKAWVENARAVKAA